MRATAALSGRLRFTTKEVGRGFYRGTRTGAMGSHTEYGGYIIDWRKTRHYVVPDLKDFNLTPFVDQKLPEPGRTRELFRDGPYYVWGKTDAVEWVKYWKQKNFEEYQEQIIEERKAMGQNQ